MYELNKLNNTDISKATLKVQQEKLRFGLWRADQQTLGLVLRLSGATAKKGTKQLYEEDDSKVRRRNDRVVGAA